MVKIPRTHIAGAIYYVTSRGDNEDVIFKDQQDYQKYLELLIKYKKQYGFGLFAFVLLPSHLHLLIELKKGLTLSDIMHDLNANYTKYFNGRYQRKGHLFQERYKMNLLEKTGQLLSHIIAYLHLNPKILGLVSDCQDYVYSSYPLYIGKEISNLNYAALNMGNEIKEALGYLEGKKYAEYLNSIPKAEVASFSKDLIKNPILGANEFIAKVQAEMELQQQATDAEGTQGKNSRKLILFGTIAIVVLGILSSYLFMGSKGMKAKLKDELKVKEIEMSNKLNQDKAFIKKDLDEKYRADLVSYQAMLKRLEIEKDKVQKLEGQVSSQKR